MGRRDLMNITNEERRRVASELRKAERHMGVYAFAKHVALAVDPENETETWGAVCSRLADLIEPSEEHSDDAGKTCDRDALLSIAAKLESDAGDMVKTALRAMRDREVGWCVAYKAFAEAYRSYAAAIREACGEQS